MTILDLTPYKSDPYGRLRLSGWYRRKRFIRDQSGASTAEYAIVLAIVTSAVAFAAITLAAPIRNAVWESQRLQNCVEAHG